MKKIFIMLAGILFFSCNAATNKSADRLWKEGQQHRVEENLKESITSFKTIIKQ